MTTEYILFLGGFLAYLPPKSTIWEPLSKASLLKLSDPSETEDRDLTEPEQLRLNHAKRNLNDILLSSLQLPNLGFFSGSGTSLLEVNGPSMWDLWRKAMWSNPDAVEGDIDHELLNTSARRVVDTVKYLEKVNPNIEHFLSQCDAYLLFNDDTNVRDFVRDVKKTILDECSGFLAKPDSDMSSHESLLQKLARRRVRDPRLKVFTTNYDLCFETASSNLGMMIVDGFSYTKNRRFDGSYFNYDVVRRESDNHEFIEGVIHLYKLHGSVSWERNAGDIVESKSPSPENAVLIYPAKGKYQQAFVQPHLELLSRFLEFLRKPNTCLVVAGFGFNDDHLSEPIISAIKSNPSLKLIIVDFNAANHITNPFDASKSYWKKLAGLALHGYDIHFINSSFSSFVSLIPNLTALSPAEQLAKTIKQMGRGK